MIKKRKPRTNHQQIKINEQKLTITKLEAELLRNSVEFKASFDEILEELNYAKKIHHWYNERISGRDQKITQQAGDILSLQEVIRSLDAHSINNKTFANNTNSVSNYSRLQRDPEFDSTISKAQTLAKGYEMGEKKLEELKEKHSNKSRNKSKKEE